MSLFAMLSRFKLLILGVTIVAAFTGYGYFGVVHFNGYEDSPYYFLEVLEDVFAYCALGIGTAMCVVADLSAFDRVRLKQMSVRRAILRILTFSTISLFVPSLIILVIQKISGGALFQGEHGWVILTAPFLMFWIAFGAAILVFASFLVMFMEERQKRKTN